MFISCNKTTPAGGNVAVPNVAGVSAGDLRIVTVDMDSINEGFQMLTDIQIELAATEQRLSADMQRQATQWQTDYENYLKIGATLTLSEQKKREADLEKRQQDLQTLQQTYANQLTNLQVQRAEEMRQFLLDYIKRFEAENGPYTFVMMTGSNSGVLFAQPSLSVTQAVLDGLNTEYKEKVGKAGKK